MKKTFFLFCLIMLILFTVSCGDVSNGILCNNCGKEIDEESKFCPHCGEIIETTTNDNQSANEDNLLNAPTKEYVVSSLEKIPGILEIVAVTEENDPNNNLDKPGWYIEKIYFSYILVNQENVLGETLLEKGLAAGGSIEVYRTKEDAESRNEYLKSFDGTILGAGSHVVAGTCVIRASEELIATQQDLLEKNIIFSLKGEVNSIIDARVQYKVKYYLEDLNNDYIFEKEVLLNDFPNVTVAPVLEKFDNFSLNNILSTTSGIVVGDGSLELSVYYKRDRFSVYCNSMGGEILSSKTVFYGQNIVLSAKVTQLGYRFVGWYSDGNLLSNQETYKCQVQNHIEAKFSVLPEMENFIFQSTSDTCKIIGIRDNTVESITIPEYITELSQCALGFKNLKVLKIEAIELADINIADESSWVFSNNPEQGVKVVFGRNVTRVPAELFYSSDSFNVREIVFENGSMCESIGRSAFFGLKNLESVAFGDNSKLKKISAFAFAECKNLKTIDFGYNSILETIDHDVFNSDKLTNICIPESVKNIGAGAIYVGSSAVKLKICCEISQSDTPVGWDVEWCKSLFDDGIEIIWNCH